MPSNLQERLGISTLRRAPTALKKYVLMVKDAKKSKRAGKGGCQEVKRHFNFTRKTKL